jgi:hypothetical protein
MWLDSTKALPGRPNPIPTADKHFVFGNPLMGPFPGTETAMFGMGCFWGAEKGFWKVKGVVSTAAGYAAGFTPNPTYKEVCSGSTGHNEVVRVIYDPKVVSYEDLLKVFWESHNPTQGMPRGMTAAPSTVRVSIRTAPRRKRRPSLPRRATRLPFESRGTPASPPRSSTPRSSISPRTTTSSTWPRTRTAIAGWVEQE